MDKKDNVGQKEILLALKALQFRYKKVLIDWLKSHNKKGVKYTVRFRQEWQDDDGWSHWGERNYAPPSKIERDGELSINDDYLPYLTPKKMNKLFSEHGLPPISFAQASQESDWHVRVARIMGW